MDAVGDLLRHAHRVRELGTSSAAASRMRSGRLRRIAIAAASGVRSVSAGFARARTLGLAAEASYWLFLALVPLAAVAGLVAARVAVAHQSTATSVLSAVPPEARSLIAPQVERVASWSGTVAPLALLTFLWLASGGVQAVLVALEVQSGRSRPWWKRRLVAVGVCVALAVGVAVLSILGAGLERVQHLAGRSLSPAALRLEQGVAWHVLRPLLSALLAVSMVAGLYRAGIPRRHGPPIPVLPGAICAVLLQWSICVAYGMVLARKGTGDAYLAGLAAVGVTMTTLWLLSVALLAGVLINCLVDDSRRSARRRAAHPVTAQKSSARSASARLELRRNRL